MHPALLCFSFNSMSVVRTRSLELSARSEKIGLRSAKDFSIPKNKYAKLSDVVEGLHLWKNQKMFRKVVITYNLKVLLNGRSTIFEASHDMLLRRSRTSANIKKICYR